MSPLSDETDSEAMAFIPQTPQHATTTVPLGSPLNSHGGTHRRPRSPGAQDFSGSPSKVKTNRSLFAGKVLAFALAVAAVAGVWMWVNFSTADIFSQRLDIDLMEVSHSSHLWGKWTKPGSVKSISILGERNSGTTWLYEHLGECFNHTVPIRRRLTRYKHWFQHETDRKDRQYDHSLVINEFRNVYHWTEAMRKVPHHAPNHVDLKWKEFVTRTWTMDRVGKDLDMTEEEKVGRVCQEDFYYKDIITCNQRPYPDGYWNASHKHRYSEHQPFYEMRNDGSGEPYDNILEFRAAKTRNLLSVINFPWVEDMWVIRYEDLLAEGTKQIISAVEKATGVKATCMASPPQNRKKRSIDKGMKKWLDDHVDWDAEGLIGYRKDEGLESKEE